MRRVAAGKNNGMAWPRRRNGVTVFCINKNGPLVEQSPKTSLIETLESRQIIEAHLINGQNKDEPRAGILTEQRQRK